MRALDPVIRIRDLCFTWPGSQTPCLSQLAFDVSRGERLFLHGESGAGKSTLLNLIGGVMLPERGEIDVLGQSLSQLSARARDRFRGDHAGFIFQQFNLIPYLSVLDNVLLPCRFSTERARRTGGSPTAEARRLLAALDMDPQLAHHPATSLSVGQQQRVSAARALIGRPELILADEPTSALDPQRQAVFIELLMSEVAASGGTLVFVSHDQRLAHLFDRCIELLAP
ncbi:ABC transporter ATP-binding protein [Zoogloea sp. LCSB751]|uniref:ABC transporter ATP-binding protein n=1 Tax=Zoogloea sp. LCSB751 TaxID=1965277 RepID=UPI0020B1693A|nr:ABC transporter ATP-binding protein [Zoogloea sp. LCSB751]